MKHLVLVTLACALFACQQDADERLSDVAEGVCGEDLPTMTWESFGDGFVLTYCQGCHASTVADRRGAPPGVVFDTEDDMIDRKDAILAAMAGATPTMPPGGGVPEDERELLSAYLKCAD